MVGKCSQHHFVQKKNECFVNEENSDKDDLIQWQSAKTLFLFWFLDLNIILMQLRKEQHKSWA